MTSEALLELRDVGKTYDGAHGAQALQVLRGVTLRIEEGEFVAIVGASGSGKSTLMNVLGCLDHPTEGSYRVDGVEVAACDGDARAALRRETFGFVFQQYHLVPGLSAAQNVELPAVYQGATRRDRRARAESLLERLGLGERAAHRREQLSGGQQQRVALARALMNGARVILADEPTGALDTKSGAEVMALFHELWRGGQTVIVVTHDHDVARAARRIVTISDGRVTDDRANDDHAGDTPRERAGAGPDAPVTASPLAVLRGTLVEAVRAALRALGVNVSRTLLTLLGVVVGVAAVVALLAVGEGARRGVIEQLSVFGTNRLYVNPLSDGPRSIAGVLTADDARWIAEVPHVVAAMPYLKGRVTVRHGNVDHTTSGSAVTPDFPRIVNWQPAKGTFFDEEDERGLAAVTLLGSKLARILFPGGEDPQRSFVLVNDVPFQVIGVLAEKGALTGDADDDDTLVFPFTTGSQRIFGTPNASWISVLVDGTEHADEATDAVTERLLREHHAKDFDVYNKAASIAAETATLDILTSLLAVTAAVSLVVGGIGVMNVMLMTVTERTGEIGIRMAVGAPRGAVLAQFLTEAVVLSSVGGVLGLALGLGVGVLARSFDAKVAFTPGASALALGCAVATGLVFGYLPAHRAAGLEPVDALVRR